ncbi:MAG: hypothetical protein OXD45_00240 [Rhodobacteraceae bacterium]|nr:hypothetical protein [Paracoccaceae bacterium]
MAAAGPGVRAGPADFRTTPVRRSDSPSIHAGNSILLQGQPHRFSRTRRQHIHNLKEGAGIPHVRMGDMKTMPMPPSSKWIDCFRGA